MLTPLGFSLLRQLSDGAFHSGEDLAATVGLTRARVSQLLKQAETAGLALERVRGRGYRLLATPDFLDAPAIRSALEEFGCDVAPADAKAPLLPAANDDDVILPPGTPAIPLHPTISVEVTDQVDSTSSELLRRASRRDIHGALLAAEWQTAGRGRRGRVWTAVAGGSLTFSLGWRFEQGAVNVAAARAPKQLARRRVDLVGDLDGDGRVQRNGGRARRQDDVVVVGGWQKRRLGVCRRDVAAELLERRPDGRGIEEIGRCQQPIPAAAHALEREPGRFGLLQQLRHSGARQSHRRGEVLTRVERAI